MATDHSYEADRAALEAERQRRQRSRSVAIAVTLGVLAALFYVVTIVKLGVVNGVM